LASGSLGRCGVQLERRQQRLDQLLDPIEQPILDEIDRLNHIDVAIRTVERTAGVEIDHGNEIDYGYGIEP
jgi:hypothetical protein